MAGSATCKQQDTVLSFKVSLFIQSWKQREFVASKHPASRSFFFSCADFKTRFISIFIFSLENIYNTCGICWKMGHGRVTDFTVHTIKTYGGGRLLWWSSFSFVYVRCVYTCDSVEGVNSSFVQSFLFFSEPSPPPTDQMPQYCLPRWEQRVNKRCNKTSAITLFSPL